MYKYQNISKNTQVITNSGQVEPREVKPGEATVADFALENPNFKFIGEDQTASADAETQTNTQTKENE